jgi:hypothetical protein
LDSRTALTGVPGDQVQGSRRHAAALASGLVIVAALAVATLGQGGFFASTQWRVAILIVGAVVLAFAASPFPLAGLRGGVVPAGLAFAAWAMVRAVAAGTAAAGLTGCCSEPAPLPSFLSAAD